MSSLLRSSKFVRHFISLARNVVTSNRPDIDGSLLQRSQNLVGVCCSNFSSSLIQMRGAQTSLDHNVRRLDEDARRSGRIAMKEIEETLNEIRRLKKASTSQSLMVIRCCGNLVPEESPERRTQLVEEIWTTLENLGVSLDISHYNALLKVYLENEHQFSPTEFLAKLEQRGIEPNRVTYQRLVSGYCQKGDIAGATKILEYMKEKQIPVSEGVFNALILGHSQADDMKSAEGILSVMKQANLEPSNETYTVLLSGFARLGDKEAVLRLITECKLKDVLLSDRDILEIAYAAAVNDHDQLVDEVLANVRNMVGYNQDAVNTLLRLITKGKDEAAYKVFMTMQSPVKSDSGLNMSGHLLIKQLVKMNRPADNILNFSERLKKDGHTSHGLSLAIETSFYHGNVDLTLGLLRALKKNGEPVRCHYFWPSLVVAGKSGNFNGLNAVLRTMVEEFGVVVNAETVRDYYLPYCGNKPTDDKLRALVENGVRRAQAIKALLAQLINQNNLKDAINLGLQHGKMNLRSLFMSRQLVDALQQTQDVQSVVALVHIINNNIMERAADDDEEGEKEEGDGNEDFPGRFLTSIVAYHETRNMVAAVLKEMVARGLSISSNSAETVESSLQGNQLTTEISELLAQLSSGELSPAPIKSISSPVGAVSIQRNPSALERLKDKFLANNESHEKVTNIYRNLFSAYCYEDDLENALRIKQEWEEKIKEEAPLGWWIQILKLYCDKEDLEKANECWELIEKMSPDGQLDPDKIISYAKLLVRKDMIDEAINILKSCKPRDLRTGFQNRNACFQFLNLVAEKTKDPEQVKTLLKTLLDENYVEMSNVVLGPVMKTYLLRDDLEGALKEFEYCVKMYKQTPWKNELASRFIEKEDATNLQTLVDLSTQVHGEINSLYDLVLSFVECGRIRQARKILETPGLRTRNARLHFACEKYKNEGLVAPLEGLVEATKDLPHIDRSDIYLNLLESYCQADNTEKAIGLWTQMQDEDVNVSDEFLQRLGNFLKSKGHPVPFSIPKSGSASASGKKETVSSEKTIKKTDQPNVQSGIKVAVAARDVNKCLQIVQDLNKAGKSLSRNELSMVLELLIQENRLKEATNMVSSLEPNKLPYMKVLSFLINRLSQEGDLDLLNQLGDKLPEDAKKLTSFNNRSLAGAVTAGKTKEELAKLENQIDNTSTPEEVDALALSFPRGGIFAILNSSPAYYEQVKRIAEKYYNKGAFAPMNCVCMFHVAEGEAEKAKEIYQRYNLKNCSRLMFKNVLTKARSTQDSKILDDLISLVKNSAGITPEAFGLLYSNLINVLVAKGDPNTGLLKLEEGLKLTPIENFRKGSLLSLKESLEAQNIPFNHTIPDKQIGKAASSTSSSSSDEEPKKSVAAKH